MDRGHRVDAGRDPGTDQQLDHHADVCGAGAHVGQRARAQREDPAIGIEREFGLAQQVASWARREQVLAAVAGPLHRADPALQVLRREGRRRCLRDRHPSSRRNRRRHRRPGRGSAPAQGPGSRRGRHARPSASGCSGAHAGGRRHRRWQPTRRAAPTVRRTGAGCGGSARRDVRPARKRWPRRRRRRAARPRRCCLSPAATPAAHRVRRRRARRPPQAARHSRRRSVRSRPVPAAACAPPHGGDRLADVVHRAHRQGRLRRRRGRRAVGLRERHGEPEGLHAGLLQLRAGQHRPARPVPQPRPRCRLPRMRACA